MSVNKLNVPLFLHHNSDFHSATQALRDGIFQTETTGLIGYVQSTLDNFQFKYPKFQYFDKEALLDPELVPDESDGVHTITNEIGPIENRLIATLLSPSYITVVLTGALGAGKTSLSNFVLDYIAKKTFLEAMCTIIKISFTEGYFQINDYKIVLKRFMEQLCERLESALTEHYSSGALIDNLIKYIEPKLSPDWEASFLPFKRKHIDTKKIEGERWEDLITSQKCNVLMRWIHEDHPDDETRLHLLGYLGRFLKVNHPSKHCVFLFLDNIDRMPDEAQAEILIIIFAFAQLTKIKTLVPLRLTTFGWITSNASFSFCHFPHLGNPPLSIVNQRIDHYISNLDLSNYQTLEEVIRNKEYVHHFKTSLKKVSELLKSPATRLHSALAAFSGESIRRGLFLAERLVKNGTIAYDNNDLYEDDLERTLIVGDTPKSSMDLDDSLIINIFFTPNTKVPTLLNIYILQILQNALLYPSPDIRIKDLLAHLRHLHNWDHQDIVDAINLLMNPRKRLLYVDGIGRYRDTKELFTHVNDKLHLTTTGKKYLDVLISDLVYIQESLVSRHICNVV